jgi:hypothetical protein
MADKLPGQPKLILKRIETEILRIRAAIGAQELQLLELDDQKERVSRNIEANKQELLKQEHNLEVTKQEYKED